MISKGSLRVGDLVTRKSYNEDLLFIIMGISHLQGEEIATLKGMNTRLTADSPLSDLSLVDDRKAMDFKRKMLKESSEHLRYVRTRRLSDEQARKKRNRRQTASAIIDDYYELPGKILHLDSDPEYLKDCLVYYRELKVPAVGEHVRVEDQPERVTQLLELHSPDILVLTGHDALKKNGDKMSLDSYKTSKYFIEAVKRARKYELDKDGLVIIAGACQSFYEAIIGSGANFASSPNRVLIQCYDPVLVAEKVSYTPIDEIVRVDEVIENTITKKPGIGGMETRGKMRLIMPNTYGKTLKL